MKNSIRRVSGELVDLRGCSRTDSGAHALGFVADFETENAMPGENWAVAINRQLADDVRIVRSAKCSPEFHSRFFARSRIYEYRIMESYKAEPMKSRFVYEDGRRLDLSKIREAVSAIVGKHDFRAFGEDLRGVNNAVREVRNAAAEKVGNELRIRIEATAFIRGMMRRISGGLFEIGIGKRSVEEFVALLNAEVRDELKWPVVLPAKGLTLVAVKYGKLRDIRLENNSKNDLADE